MEGLEIGNWRLERKIGEGGMGEVYLARHKVLDTPAAVKVVSLGLTHDPKIRDRFFREARTQANLRHPNIVQVLDYLEHDGRWFLIAEYLEKGSLADRLKGRATPVGMGRALDWGIQALYGLDFAHQKGIIHRDVKPSNLLLDAGETLKVTDFGIALELGGRKLTTTGTTLGTPQYMSPEQIRHPQDIDHRSDVYSMGIVLYELLTGSVPFGTDTDSDFEIQSAQVNALPRPLRERNAAIPEALEPIVLRALAKDPNLRYSGCGEFARAIEAFRQKPAAAAAPPPVVRAVAAAPPPKKVPPPPPRVPVAQASRPRGWLIPVACAAVLLGGIGLYKIVHHGGSGDEPADDQAVVAPPSAAPGEASDLEVDPPQGAPSTPPAPQLQTDLIPVAPPQQDPAPAPPPQQTFTPVIPLTPAPQPRPDPTPAPPPPAPSLDSITDLSVLKARAQADAGKWMEGRPRDVEPSIFKGYFVRVKGSYKYIGRGAIVKGQRWSSGSVYWKVVFGYLMSTADHSWYGMSSEFTYLGPEWKPIYGQLSNALAAEVSEKPSLFVGSPKPAGYSTPTQAPPAEVTSVSALKAKAEADAGKWLGTSTAEPPTFRGYFIRVSGTYKWIGKGAIVRGYQWTNDRVPKWKVVYGYLKATDDDTWFGAGSGFAYLGPDWKPVYRQLSDAVAAEASEKPDKFVGYPPPVPTPPAETTSVSALKAKAEADVGKWLGASSTAEPSMFRGYFIRVKGSTTWIGKGAIVRGQQWTQDRVPKWKVVYGYLKATADNSWFGTGSDFAYLGPDWKPVYRQLSNAFAAEASVKPDKFVIPYGLP